jgi:hypothetical protein
MTDNVCGKTTIYNQVMPKRKEKAEAQNKTNQRATKKRTENLKSDKKCRTIEFS